MFIPITTAALVLMTVAMLLLRIFWLRVPSRLRFFLIGLSIAAILLQGLFVVTKWTTTSDRLNVLINWVAIGGYQLLVLLFSRLSPRWLTIPSAIVLLIPLFAASILIPLTPIFQPVPDAQVPMGDHLFYEVRPWVNAGSGANAGVDLVIYYRPPLFPFLRRRLQAVPFNNAECNSFGAIAIALPAKKIAVCRCPR